MDGAPPRMRPAAVCTELARCRFDGIYAICEDKDKAFFAIETSELPQGAKAGDVLKITDDGALSIDVEETERRRARILEKQKKLMGL